MQEPETREMDRKDGQEFALIGVYEEHLVPPHFGIFHDFCFDDFICGFDLSVAAGINGSS